jgi:zinc protease
VEIYRKFILAGLAIGNPFSFAFTLLAIASFALGQTIPEGVEKKAAVGGITEYDYPNGLRVLLFPDSASPKVTVNITYLVGSRFEGYGESGMAHLLEHMNFILSVNGRNIKKELTDHGADWNGTTSYDRTNYYETVPATDDNLKWALGLEAERMVKMRIEKSLLDTEMTVVRNEFELGENDAARVLFERVLATAYLWHNYGKAVIGSRADIEKVPFDRLEAFYRKYYQPDNAILVIAGQFDQSKALAYVAQTCGTIPRPARKLDETYTEEPVQDGERFVALRRVGDNPMIRIAWHVPSASNGDSTALAVLAGILAGNGSSGRLYNVLVDNKKAVSVTMNAQQLHDPGLVMVAAVLGNGQSLDDARKIILNTISGIVNEPPAKEEVEREKTRILHSIEQSMSNPQEAALALSNQISSGDWRLAFLRYDRVKTVTSEDVVRVAKLYFKDSNQTLGEFVPTAEPDRVAVPTSPDLGIVFKGYKTGLDLTPGQAFDPTPANIEKALRRATLPDGLKVDLLPKANRGGTVFARLEIEFGDAQTLAGRYAVANLAAAMLMRGTRHRTRQQIQDEMVRINARINITAGAGDLITFNPSVGIREATVTIQTKGENLVPALRLVAEMLREPAFPESEFESAKQKAIADVEKNRTDPQALAVLELVRAANPAPKGDPRYPPTIEEQLEDARKITLDDVKKFHAQFYGSSHGELVIAGEFDPTEIGKVAADLFGDWKSQAPFQRIPQSFQKTTTGNRKIETPDKQNSVFTAALPLLLEDDDPDYPALDLANYIFGASITGRVPDRIRNREGLSYGVGTALVVPAAGDGNAATLAALAISNPKNAPKVEASFRDELEKALAAGFSGEEVAAAKKALLDELRVTRTQDPQLIRGIANLERSGRTLAWEEQLEAKIATLTADQVNAAFRKHLDVQSLIIVKAGDFKAAGVYQ